MTGSSASLTLSALRAGRVWLRFAPVRSAATRIGTCSRHRARGRVCVALPTRRRGLRFAVSARPSGSQARRSRRPRRSRHPAGPALAEPPPGSGGASDDAVLGARQRRAVLLRPPYPAARGRRAYRRSPSANDSPNDSQRILVVQSRLSARGSKDSIIITRRICLPAKPCTSKMAQTAKVQDNGVVLELPITTLFRISKLFESIPNGRWLWANSSKPLYQPGEAVPIIIFAYDLPQSIHGRVAVDRSVYWFLAIFSISSQRYNFVLVDNAKIREGPSITSESGNILLPCFP